VVLFINWSKSAEHPNRPDYYGYCHTGLPNAVPMHVSVWTKTASNGKAMLTGNTSVYEPKEKERVMEPEPPAPTKRRQRSKAMS